MKNHKILYSMLLWAMFHIHFFNLSSFHHIFFIVDFFFLFKAMERWFYSNFINKIEANIKRNNEFNVNWKHQDVLLFPISLILFRILNFLRIISTKLTLAIAHCCYFSQIHTSYWWPFIHVNCFVDFIQFINDIQSGQIQKSKSDLILCSVSTEMDHHQLVDRRDSERSKRKFEIIWKNKEL